MRLSNHALTPLSTKQFWLAVAVGTVIVAGIGLCHAQVWFVNGERYLNITLLVFLWTCVLIAFIRFRGATISWSHAGFIAGITLSYGAKLWPHAPLFVGWIGSAGDLILMASILSPYFTFAKRASTVPSVGTLAASQ